jgi:hypothetical protein
VQKENFVGNEKQGGAAYNTLQEKLSPKMSGCQINLHQSTYCHILIFKLAKGKKHYNNGAFQGIFLLLN